MALGRYKIPRELQDQDLWFKVFTKKQLLISVISLAACIGICIVANTMGILIIGVVISLFIIILTGALLFLKMPQKKHMNGGGYGLDVLAIRVLRKKLLKKNKYIYTYLAPYEYAQEDDSKEATIQAVKNKAINISANDMRNFSASTRAQIAEARREQIRKENVRKLAHRAGSTVVRKIAVTGAQVTGAAFMAFGGEEASMTGAQLAGYAAEGMVDKAGNLATGVYNNQAEIRANVVAAGNGVANAGRAVVNTVRRVQRRPQTPNRYNPNAGNPTNPASSAPAQPRSASDEVFGNTQSGMRNH